MKTTQRNFIVEFKSARRKIGEPKPSIWGNADLKALAREAAAEAEELFAPIAIKATDIENAELETAAAQVVDPVDSHQLPEPKLEAAPETREMDTAALALIVGGSTASTIEPATVPVAKTPRQKRNGQSNTAANSRPKMSDVGVGEDELNTLVEENRRLKTVLRQQLLAQNSQLREMLGRFSV